MTFVSAFILGLVASIHCSGMCGGLQAAFQSNVDTVVIRSKRLVIVHLLLLNLGRIFTYVALGVILVTLGYSVVSGFDLPTASLWMRRIMGILILLIGLQLIFRNRRPFQLLEPLGGHLWQGVNSYIKVNSSRSHRVFINGMIWGLLPCGLVYSVLLTSVFSGNLEGAALVMFGFGLGSLPSMLLTGVVFVKFRDSLNSSGVRYAGGLFFIAGGLLILTAPFWVSKAFIQEYPILLNSVFCIT